jgi:hypothetical protein
MKASGLIQVVIILLLLAFAASCEVGQEYTRRVFRSAPPNKKDSSSIRFIQADSSDEIVTLVKKELPEKIIIDSVKNNDPDVKEPIPAGIPATGTIRTKKVRQ